MELDKGIIIEKLNIKDRDTLVVTFDTDILDIEECQYLSNFLQKQFPNNKLIFKLKGIDLEIKKENTGLSTPHEVGPNWDYPRFEHSKYYSWRNDSKTYSPNYETTPIVLIKG